MDSQDMAEVVPLFGDRPGEPRITMKWDVSDEPMKPAARDRLMAILFEGSAERDVA